ncbi:hypothetical protein [Gemmatimonas sp.]|uniref:hypothetical protein n=1 Tax=Gemmatimonas sp. TaxID=1962908 RepID=UPI00286DC140|nr:hypothetical protein [Gemmatimonas sp.]
MQHSRNSQCVRSPFKKGLTGFFAPVLISASIVLGACGPAAPHVDALQSLAATTPTQLKTSALCALFKYGSENTDLQREEAEEQMRGSVVEWNVQVYEISKLDETAFLLTSSDCLGPDRAPAVSARVVALSAEDQSYVRRLQTGDIVRIRGRIDGVSFSRHLELNPAVFADGTTLRAAVAQVESRAVVDAPKEKARKSAIPPVCRFIQSNSNPAVFDSIFADAPKEYFAGGEVYFDRDMWFPHAMCTQDASEYAEYLDMKVDEGVLDARLVRFVASRLGADYSPPPRSERGRFMERVRSFLDSRMMFGSAASDVRNVIRFKAGGECERIVIRAMNGEADAIVLFADTLELPEVCRDRENL